MVRQWQELFYGRRYSATRMNSRAGFRQAGRGLRRGGPAGRRAPRRWSRCCSEGLA
ncbi:MAG: hypothetical protein MZV70_08375 [Desulfobacterales bacterium]|nr:hypothetical protein [Desulfobacterales bacterium]